MILENTVTGMSSLPGEKKIHRVFPHSAGSLHSPCTVATISAAPISDINRISKRMAPTAST